MNKRDDFLSEMRAAHFIENNGKVLRAINILRTGYERLKEVEYALKIIPENEFLDCINYLSESGYIKLRSIKNRQSTELSDTSYEELEAKLTQKGIQLLAGKIFDELVEV